MDRRSFVVGGVAGGAAILGGGFPASAEPTGPFLLDGDDVTAADMARFLGKLDGHLARSRQKQHLPTILPQFGARLSATPTAADRADLERGERLYQNTIRSLLLVGSLGDLPLKGQVHPGMQARIRRGLPEMSEALNGATDYMTGMSGAERIDLARALQDDPKLAMRAVGAIDEQAEYVGLPKKRRSHLREMARHVAWRFEHQGATAVIDEYADKIEKARASGPATIEDLQRRLVARIGERTFWDYEARIRRHHAEWMEAKATGGILLAQADRTPMDEVDTAAPPSRYTPPPFAPPPPGFAPSFPDPEHPPQQGPSPSNEEKPGHTAMMTAAWMLGIGGVSVTIGLPIFFFGGIAGIIVGSVFFTQAGVTLIGGLIALFVGLAQRNS